MMPAPSCASRTACDRPWPRAAPVMKASLPSTRPVISVPLLPCSFLSLCSAVAARYLIKAPASTGSVTPSGSGRVTVNPAAWLVGCAASCRAAFMNPGDHSGGDESSVVPTDLRAGTTVRLSPRGVRRPAAPREMRRTPTAPDVASHVVPAPDLSSDYRGLITFAVFACSRCARPRGVRHDNRPHQPEHHRTHHFALWL